MIDCPNEFGPEAYDARVKFSKFFKESEITRCTFYVACKNMARKCLADLFFIFVGGGTPLGNGVTNFKNECKEEGFISGRGAGEAHSLHCPPRSATFLCCRGDAQYKRHVWISYNMIVSTLTDNTQSKNKKK